MRLSLLIFCGATLATTASIGCVSQAAQARGATVLDHHALTPEIIQILENKMKMPRGSRGLDSYIRYYTIQSLPDGSPYIVGRFEATFEHRGYWKIVSPPELPDWQDGGCGLLHFGAVYETLVIDGLFCAHS